MTENKYWQDFDIFNTWEIKLSVEKDCESTSKSKIKQQVQNFNNENNIKTQHKEFDL